MASWPLAASLKIVLPMKTTYSVVFIGIKIYEVVAEATNQCARN
jgi:hypothetical protein